MAWFKKDRKPIAATKEKASRVPEGLWVKCPTCSQAIYNKDLAANLNVCPKCKKGNLAITYSKKNRRYFVACDKYPECKNTYSLPPNGLSKRANKICDECGFQMIMLLKKGRRPWIFCFNPDCETNRKRIEEYRKRKEMENKNLSEKAGEESENDSNDN